MIARPYLAYCGAVIARRIATESMETANFFLLLLCFLTLASSSMRKWKFLKKETMFPIHRDLPIHPFFTVRPPFTVRLAGGSVSLIAEQVGSTSTHSYMPFGVFLPTCINTTSLAFLLLYPNVY
ncbi:hypothetical protein J3F84DRAFT_382426 [Trichoderma pleuroticola]